MKTNNLISRNEAMRELHELGGCGAEKGSWDDGWDQAITEAINVVMSLPSRYVKNKRIYGKSSRVARNNRERQAK